MHELECDMKRKDTHCSKSITRRTTVQNDIDNPTIVTDFPQRTLFEIAFQFYSMLKLTNLKLQPRKVVFTFASIMPRGLSTIIKH